VVNVAERAQVEEKLPKGWKQKKLGGIAETCSGTTPSRVRKDYYIGSIPWVKTGELQDSSIADTEEHVSESALKETSLKLLPPETLLIAMYGQGQTRGRTGLLKKSATTNQACFAILPNPERFDSTYLQFWFRYSYHRIRRETEGRGGNQPNLNGKLLREQDIPLPPLAEQKRIVAILTDRLSTIDKARTATETQLKAAKALPAAYLREVFDSPEAQKWGRKRLGDVCELLPAKSIATEGDTEVLAITTACLSETGFQSAGIKRARMRSQDAALSRVSSGEVLIARSNTSDLVGRVTIYSGEIEGVVASDLTIRIKTGSTLQPNFLTNYLSSLYIQGYWKKRAGGASDSIDLSIN
jgi:type I restriction enzyme S subunit